MAYSGQSGGNILVIDHAEMEAMLTADDGPVSKEIKRLAYDVDLEAKRLCPVDIGRLKSSIHPVYGHDEHGPVAFVGSDVEYAIYQELGTRFQTGKAYLRPALQSVLAGSRGSGFRADLVPQGGT